MTSTETAATPRKRAPRKAAAKAAGDDTAKAGVDHRAAEAAREQLEAGGQQVTAKAVERLRATREQAAAAADRSVAAALAASVGHPDDPGPGEPDDLDDAGPDLGEAADVAAALQTDGDPGAGQTEPADAAPRTARETAPRAGAGDALDAALAAADLDEEAREAIAERADQLAAAVPDDVTVCGGTPSPADAAAIAAFAEQLTAAAVGDYPAGSIAEAAEADQWAHYVATSGDVDEAFDVRQLVADVDAALPFDYGTLIAGHIGIAPDGTRVTVVDWPGVDDTPTPPCDPTTGEVIDLDGAGATVVTLSPEDAAAIEEARELEARAGELKEAAEAIKSRIRERLGGEAGRGEVAKTAAGTVLANWTRYTETRLDGTALKRDHPELWAAYAKTSARRRFTWAD